MTLGRLLENVEKDVLVIVFMNIYGIQKEKRSRYRKVMEKLDEREKRRAGR